ncbi:MAG: DUF1848 domain-containing protein [Proteobacteria bacterium]|nr:DUF1848 domain-containing protein [Pseudomonadota bacterium]
MIVSASYKTDIPAFYGPWFSNRLRAGKCLVANPYGGKPFSVSLRKPDIDGFVFWTRNVGPFFGVLEVLKVENLPFIVQFTITGYPRQLDAATIPANQAIGQLKQLRDQFGIDVPVWRYDPIAMTSATAAAWHIKNFEALAAQLNGTVNEVVVSFMQVYRKTQRNLDHAVQNQDAEGRSFSWRNPEADEKSLLLSRLAEIADNNNMRLSLCGQPELVSSILEDARCIDDIRLSAIAGKPLSSKSASHRKTCRCAASRDIGAYDSCPHGCVYCYAVKSRETAKARFNAHDPNDISLK